VEWLGEQARDTVGQGALMVWKILSILLQHMKSEQEHVSKTQPNIKAFAWKYQTFTLVVPGRTLHYGIEYGRLFDCCEQRQGQGRGK